MMELQALTSTILPMLAQASTTAKESIDVRLIETPKDSTSLYIAIAALFLAFCAFALSIWEASANRKHNLLSVRPAVTVQKVFGNQEKLGLFLANFGVGPAFIKDITLIVEDSRFSIDTTEGWANAFGRIRSLVSRLEDEYDFGKDTLTKFHFEEFTRKLDYKTFPVDIAIVPGSSPFIFRAVKFPPFSGQALKL